MAEKSEVLPGQPPRVYGRFHLRFPQKFRDRRGGLHPGPASIFCGDRCFATGMFGRDARVFMEQLQAAFDDGKAGRPFGKYQHPKGFGNPRWEAKKWSPKLQAAFDFGSAALKLAEEVEHG